MNNIHIHLVSDSTGETVSSIVRSVMSQFTNVTHTEHIWSLVRTEGQMQRVIDSIKAHNGIVMYTIIDDELQTMLMDACLKLKLPCVPVLNRAMRELSNYIGMEAKGIVGRQYELDDEYFSRVEAINFTLAHDDGQLTEDLNEADIVLVGVSRTSKTPTCVYLSYRGLNVANVPFVHGCPLPENLYSLTKPIIIGLIISPDRLAQIRKSRLLSLNENRETDYSNLEKIKEEVAEVRKIFNQQGWTILDVTRRSVEETAAIIMQHYTKFKNSK